MRYLADELSGRPWAGQRCFIIGGGRSLKGFDFEMLRGEHIIAINRAVEYCPFADIMFSLDSRLYGWYRRHKIDGWEKFESFRGLRVWVETPGGKWDNDVLLVRKAGHFGLSFSLADGIYTGGNSGYAAVNLAVAMGASVIDLLGFDMDKRGNFHSGYPTPGGDPKARGWIEGMNKLAGLLQSSKIKVVNLNPKSKLKCFPFGEIKINDRAGKWKVISFYTKGTGYETEIEALRKSLDKFKIPYKFYGVDQQGSWRMNLNFKSKVILKAMREFPKWDIVFIDADGIVRQYPKLFDELSANGYYDVAATFHKYSKRSGDSDELLSGTLWIQNCQSARELVECWHEIGMANQNIRHQKCLKLAIEKMNREHKLYRMPFEYTYVFDYRYFEKREPVIEHFQASRRFRAAVGFGVDMIKGQTT
jgi:hypothetical protein